MKCHNCAKPVMFLFGEEGQQIPLCLDCSVKYQDLLDREQINLERRMNHLAQEFDRVAGSPGCSPQFPP